MLTAESQQKRISTRCHPERGQRVEGQCGCSCGQPEIWKCETVTYNPRMRAFEVWLNGKKLCLAGIGDDGVLSVIANWVVGKGVRIQNSELAA